MFSNRIRIAGVLLICAHYAHTFVLLTANIDDVKKIARKFVSEPMAQQIADFIAKAAGQQVDNPNVSVENENVEVRNSGERKEPESYDKSQQTASKPTTSDYETGYASKRFRTLPRDSKATTKWNYEQPQQTPRVAAKLYNRPNKYQQYQMRQVPKQGPKNKDSQPEMPEKQQKAKDKDETVDDVLENINQQMKRPRMQNPQRPMPMKNQQRPYPDQSQYQNQPHKNKVTDTYQNYHNQNYQNRPHRNENERYKKQRYQSKNNEDYDNSTEGPTAQQDETHEAADTSKYLRQGTATDSDYISHQDTPLMEADQIEATHQREKQKGPEQEQKESDNEQVGNAPALTGQNNTPKNPERFRLLDNSADESTGETTQTQWSFNTGETTRTIDMSYFSSRYPAFNINHAELTTEKEQLEFDQYGNIKNPALVATSGPVGLQAVAEDDWWMKTASPNLRAADNSGEHNFGTNFRSVQVAPVPLRSSNISVVDKSTVVTNMFSNTVESTTSDAATAVTDFRTDVANMGNLIYK